MDKELPEEPGPAAEKLWKPGVVFTRRELQLITNCNLYAGNKPAGLPGHNLMIIIDKFDQLLGQMAGYLTPEQVEASRRSLPILFARARGRSKKGATDTNSTTGYKVGAAGHKRRHADQAESV